MPQAIVVAGITAASALGGAALSSGAAGRASRRQQESTDRALQLEREREAEARRRYDQQWEMYNQQMQQREAIRRQLLRQRGIDIPEPTSLAQNNRINEPGGKLTLGSMMPGGSNLPPGATDVGMQKLPVGGGAPAGPVGAIPAPDSGGLGPPLVPQGQQGMTLGDLSGWSDWGRYTGQPAR